MSYLMYSWTDILSKVYDKYLKIDYFTDDKVNNLLLEKERLIKEKEELIEELQSEQDLSNFWKYLFEQTEIKYRKYKKYIKNYQ